MIRGSAIILVLVLITSNATVQGEVTEVQHESDELGHSAEETSIFLQATREPDLTLVDVRKIIDHFDCFEQMPDRSGLDPFTNEPLVFSGEGKAVYLEGGEAKGNFAVEDGRILFTGVPESIVKDVAALISAMIEPWDNS